MNVLELLLNLAIVIAFLLFVIAHFMKMTIGELLESIKNLFGGKEEDG